MKFLLLRLHCISINLPCDRAWNTVVMPGLVSLPSCYLELLDKLKKWISRIVGPALTVFLEPLAHHHNVASLSLFYRYDFGRSSFELAQLVSCPCSPGRSTCYSDRLHYFPVTIPKWYKDVYVNSFFPCTTRLWICPQNAFL